MAALLRDQLPDGLPGTARTLTAMRDLAAGPWGARSAIIRALALNIVREAAVPEKDYLGEVVALFQWVQRSIRYVRDPIGQELVTAPETLVQTRAGDCDDHAVMLAALLGSLGHRSRFVTIGFQADQPERFSHVYLEAQPAGSDTWIPLDAIKKDRPAGWEAVAPVRRVWPANDQDHPMIASDLSDLGRFRLKKITRAVSRIAAPVARVAAPVARIAAPVTRPIARVVPAPLRRVAAVAAAPATGGASLLLLARQRAAARRRVAAPVVDPAAVAMRDQAVASLRAIAADAAARANDLDAQVTAAAVQERDQAAALLRSLAEEAAAQAAALEAQAIPTIDTTAEVLPAPDDAPAMTDEGAAEPAWN